MLVTFAFFAPVAIVLMAFVLDAGNWFEHQRHLQLEADASALAAAGDFQPCNNTFMYQHAGYYGGVSGVIAPAGSGTALLPLLGAPINPNSTPVNQQFGGTASSVHEAINTTDYYRPNQVLSSTGDPCSSGVVDVKMTETDLPWYFQALSVPYIDSHARVELKQQLGGPSALPLAEGDTNPISATAYYIDESSGQTLAVASLVTQAPAGGQAIWRSVQTPVSISATAIGVVIALDYTTASLPRTAPAACAQLYVKCFDSDYPNTHLGVLHIQGSTATTGSSTIAPQLGPLKLVGNNVDTSATCADGYFSNPGGGFATGSNCTIGVQANVDFGLASHPSGAKFDVDAVVAGKCYPLTYRSTAASPSTLETWTSAATAPSQNTTPPSSVCGTVSGSGYPTLASGNGSTPVSIWVADTVSGTHSAPFSNVQRSYTAVTNTQNPPGLYANGSGPIASAWISADGGTTPDAASFPQCASGCTQNLVVQVALTAAQTVGPLVHLSSAGNQTGAVDCNGNGSGSANILKQEFVSGCTPAYIQNAGTDCSLWNNGLPQPWQCVSPYTGVKANKFASGIASRYAGCPTNNWSATTPSGSNIPEGDPRAVPMLIVPEWAFSNGGSSQANFPVSNFATFYVTGWSGDTCPGDVSESKNSDIIDGHFITYINPPGSSIPGGTCTTNTLNPCSPVLTQ